MTRSNAGTSLFADGATRWDTVCASLPTPEITYPAAPHVCHDMRAHNVAVCSKRAAKSTDRSRDDTFEQECQWVRECLELWSPLMQCQLDELGIHHGDAPAKVDVLWVICLVGRPTR